MAGQRKFVRVACDVGRMKERERENDRDLVFAAFSIDRSKNGEIDVTHVIDRNIV